MVLKVCVHEWLSGGVSPCQGEGRGFESRLVLSKREKKESSDGWLFFYVQALPGSNGSNVCVPLRSSQSNVPRTFCDVSCSQRDTKKDIRWMALFSMFKPCRVRTVRMSAFHSGRRSRTSPGRSATSHSRLDEVTLDTSRAPLPL